MVGLGVGVGAVKVSVKGLSQQGAPLSALLCYAMNITTRHVAHDKGLSQEGISQGTVRELIDAQVNCGVTLTMEREPDVPLSATALPRPISHGAAR